MTFHRHQMIEGGINRFAHIVKLGKATEFVLSQGGATGSLCALHVLLTCAHNLTRWRDGRRDQGPVRHAPESIGVGPPNPLGASLELRTRLT